MSCLQIIIIKFYSREGDTQADEINVFKESTQLPQISTKQVIYFEGPVIDYWNRKHS